jgi:hypoxanthine phosphoribosyltransferase
MEIYVNNTAMIAKILFSEQELQKKVKELAQKINQDYGTKNTLTILVVLHGALIFGSDLIRNLEMPTALETVRLKSYQGTSNTGSLTLVTPLPQNLEGKHVLVVEDIVDTGQSLSFLKQELEKTQAASVKLCTLLDKPQEVRQSLLQPDYTAFQIGKNFVIGYGLDLDGKFRNLPYIAELIPKKSH